MVIETLKHQNKKTSIVMYISEDEKQTIEATAIRNSMSCSTLCRITILNSIKHMEETFN